MPKTCYEIEIRKKKGSTFLWATVYLEAAFWLVPGSVCGK